MVDVLLTTRVAGHDQGVDVVVAVVVGVSFPFCRGWLLVHRARSRSIRAGLSCESDW